MGPKLYVNTNPVNLLFSDILSYSYQKEINPAILFPSVWAQKCASSLSIDSDFASLS